MIGANCTTFGEIVGRICVTLQCFAAAAWVFFGVKHDDWNQGLRWAAIISLIGFAFVIFKKGRIQFGMVFLALVPTVGLGQAMEGSPLLPLLKCGGVVAVLVIGLIYILVRSAPKQ